MSWGGGRPDNIRKKLLRQTENLPKNYKNSLASGSAAPEPRARREFSIIIKFLFKFAQKFMKFMKVIHKFLEKFSSSRTSYYSLFILYSLFFPVPMKIKNLEKFHFSRIFSVNFQFLTFKCIFLKNYPNYRALPNSKISFRPSKVGPPNIWRTPSTEKILQKLLQL